MQTPEILSLIEEAAGTRMNETKKESALKTSRGRRRARTDAGGKYSKRRRKYQNWLLKKGKASMGGEVKTLSENVDVLAQDLVRVVSVLNNKEDTLRSDCVGAEKSVEMKWAAADKKFEEGSSLENKFSPCEKDVKETTHPLMSKNDEAVAVEHELSARRKDVENAKSAQESFSYKEGQMEACQKDCASELKLVQKLKDEIRDLSAQLSNVQFIYRDPVRNFDRSKVKGVVAKLIKVNDSSTMTALEVTAGGKLFNVVVDTESTGKQLLQNGDLRRRVTIIPLNKIQPHTVPIRVQQAAVRLVGKENAELALTLVGYDEELKTAMEYVFGSTFVCKNIDAAKEVAFSREIRTPSVTLEGDIFQPSGLLTGGSRKWCGDLLRQLHELAEAESNLTLHQRRLSEIEAKVELHPLSSRITELLPVHKKFADLKKQLELKLAGLAEQNEHHKLGEVVKKIEQELEEAKSAAKEKQILYNECCQCLKNLSKSTIIIEKASLKTWRETNKATKAQMQSVSKDLKGHENERERLIMEQEAVMKEHASLESQLGALRAQISRLNLELEEQKAKVASTRNNHDQVQSELNAIRLKMKERDSQISSILKEQQKLQHKLSETKLDRKKLENEVKRMEMEQKDCSMKVDKLIEKHAWIASEKQLFGRSGTDYDFLSLNPSKAKEELDNCKQSNQGVLEKRVNKKVMAMFEKAEDEYNDLMSKKNIIENDKSKINKVIEELDEKKKETLKVTWVKVNNDFGSIFSTLLPGTMAKLEPPEGCSFLDGLEVRVAFGGVWKQSLSELSGGQRSLLALSIILALLLFKPAPLYILDEITPS
ncbi:hypothetical protein NC651_009764 [Populus alba x Populus x berolinensis]|nr:hypothetical protein NC651_009764 [Populus alba x Populus x berolinensis]